jgi:hypothetical protein
MLFLAVVAIFSLGHVHFDFVFLVGYGIVAVAQVKNIRFSIIPYS